MAVQVDEEKHKGIDMVLVPLCLDNVAEVAGSSVTDLFPGEVLIRDDFSRVSQG